MTNLSHNIVPSTSSYHYFTHLLNASAQDESLFFNSLSPGTEFQYTSCQDEGRHNPAQQYSYANVPTVFLSSTSSTSSISSSISSSSSTTTTTTSPEKMQTPPSAATAALLGNNVLVGNACMTEVGLPSSAKGSKPLLPYASNLVNLSFGRTKPTSSKSSSNSASVQPSKKKKRASAPPSTTSQNGMYRCDEDGCTKTFTRRYNLTSHKRTHSMERPYPCYLCPKKFARVHDRNRHAKLHLGIMSYVCPHCHKAFARQDALSRHLKPTLEETRCCTLRGPVIEEEQ